MIDGADVYDVLIVGGGPAGSSAAIHLATHGARVLLAEQKKFPRAKVCGEFISPECFDHFERLGVASRMRETDGVWLTETDFYSRGGKRISVPTEWFGSSHATAFGLSRAEMDARLLERARQAGVTVLEETHAVNPLIEDDRVTGVFLKGDDESVTPYRAHVTIDASGRARAVARRIAQRIQRQEHHTQPLRPRFVAFKAHLEGTRGTPGHCEIYSYRGGYGGLNSVEGGVSNLCFIASSKDVRACGNDAERVVNDIVKSNRRAAFTLGEASNATPWLAVSIDAFGKHELVPADGLMSVGDAASFIDPFTGSGMLMALESGELAALAITPALTRLGNKASFASLAETYRNSYRQKFARRLRICSILRRTAFIPRLADTAMFILGHSACARRRVARATRPVERTS